MVFGNTTASNTAGSLFGQPTATNQTNANSFSFSNTGSSLFGGPVMNPIFTIYTTGRAEIPFPAERAVLNLTISSCGTNKAGVSDEVLTTAAHIENLLRDLSPKDNSPEAKAAAPLAHWSKTDFSSKSHIPYAHPGSPEKPRIYECIIKFDVRFKEFKALGAFGAKITSLAHVEVQKIDWILKAATEKANQARLRKEAARDALQKARDYCEVLGCTNIRPVEIHEGLRPNGSMGLFGMPAAAAPVTYQQSAPGFGQMGQARMSGAANESNEGLEFLPQEVHMSTEVTIRFQAEFVPEAAQQATTKDNEEF